MVQATHEQGTIHQGGEEDTPFQAAERNQCCHMTVWILFLKIVMSRLLGCRDGMKNISHSTL